MQLALIPYSLKRDSIPQQVADFIHSYGMIWDGETKRAMTKRNLLLEYSEELAAKIVKICYEY